MRVTPLHTKYEANGRGRLPSIITPVGMPIIGGTAAVPVRRNTVGDPSGSDQYPFGITNDQYYYFNHVIRRLRIQNTYIGDGDWARHDGNRNPAAALPNPFNLSDPRHVYLWPGAKIDNVDEQFSPALTRILTLMVGFPDSTFLASYDPGLPYPTRPNNRHPVPLYGINQLGHPQLSNAEPVSPAANLFSGGLVYPHFIFAYSQSDFINFPAFATSGYGVEADAVVAGTLTFLDWGTCPIYQINGDPAPAQLIGDVTISVPETDGYFAYADATYGPAWDKDTGVALRAPKPN